MGSDPPVRISTSPEAKHQIEHFGHAIVEVGGVAVGRRGHDCDNLRHGEVPFEGWRLRSADRADTTNQRYESRHRDAFEPRTLGGVPQWSATSPERKKGDRDFRAGRMAGFVRREVRGARRPRGHHGRLGARARRARDRPRRGRDRGPGAGGVLRRDARRRPRRVRRRSPCGSGREARPTTPRSRPRTPQSARRLEAAARGSCASPSRHCKVESRNGGMIRTMPRVGRGRLGTATRIPRQRPSPLACWWRLGTVPRRRRG